MTFIRTLSSAALLLAAATFGTAPASAQGKATKAQLAGTWMIVSATSEKDGKKTDTYGPNPMGTQVYDANGHFAVIITRSDVPKFAINNRLQGTPEENKTTVHGSIGYFGAYTLDEATGLLTLKIEGATFPNFIGDMQKRRVAISGDELTITNPSPSAGGGAATFLFKRAK